MGKHSKKATVQSHTRTVRGKKQTVRGHSRKTTWTDSRKAAVAAGGAGLVFAVSAVQFGFEVATVLVLVLSALVGIAFTVANGGRGTKRGKSVARRLLAPQGKKGRSKNKGAFTCRRCKGKFTNPLIHVCQIKWSKSKGQRSDHGLTR